MSLHLPPPYTAANAVNAQMHDQGYALLNAATLCTDWGVDITLTTAQWQPLWEHLPPDAHLRDGGRYRQRRHGCFVVDHGVCTAVPHRAHWQPVEYNALHGGIERWFEPLLPALSALPAWSKLLLALAKHADNLHGPQPWFGEAHQFRIDTQQGIGRPTPEGAHRDGVDLVAVILLARTGVKGGETRVFDATGPQGLRFTLTEPLSCLLLDDARVVHETTPIQSSDPAAPGWRDTLVVTLRRGGFQSAAAP
jgi:hypothetical protein